MPQIRICPNCNKILQVGEIHDCRLPRSELVTCNKCGQKYKAVQTRLSNYNKMNCHVFETPE